MMNWKKINKLFSVKYKVMLVPVQGNATKVFKIDFIKAILSILLLLILSNLLLIFLISYTPLGKILPDSPYLSKNNYDKILELQEKVVQLSREVERVQQINERLNLIIEGKPIPIDPRDLDTNYQKERMRRDSLRILGKSNFTNNLYNVLLKILEWYYNNDLQDENSSTKREYIFFIKPADGLVTRGFNQEISHYGIDFSMPVGSVVRASASGVIVFADYTINDGYKIIISHTHGYFTIYKHLSQLLKRERDYVKQGDIIALSGNTGKLTTGPHLHFEIWKYQTPIDPKKILVDLNEKQK